MLKSNRPLIMGENGAVATNHPQATSIGLDVLRDGGNAVDASVAISLALGIVEPACLALGATASITFGWQTHLKHSFIMVLAQLLKQRQKIRCFHQKESQFLVPLVYQCLAWLAA